MTEKIRVPQLSDDENGLVNRLLERIDKKGTRNRMRSAYYDGRKAARMLTNVVPEQYQNIGLALGWAGKAVDGLTRRTVIDEFVSPGGPDLESLGLLELEESNFLFSELAQARTDSALHGVSYLVTTQGAEGEPRALVHAKSALDSTGDWNDRARKLDNFLSITDRDDRQVTGFALYLPNLIVNASKKDGKWQAGRTEHSWGVPVEPQVYKPRTSRRHGKSRITRPVMGLQDATLRALLRIEGHMDIYAVPQMVLRGAMEDMFRNADGTFKSSMQIVMGRVLAIPDDEDPSSANPRVDVDQFDAQSPKPHIEQVNMLAKLMSRETNLPDSDFALTDFANPTSGDSYIQGRDDLITEAEGAQDDWAPGTRRTVRRALAIQNGLTEIPKDWDAIRERWRDPRYTSKAAVADAGAKQIQAAPWLADTTVGLRLLGLNPDDIQEALSARRVTQGRQVVEAVLNANSGANAGSDSTGNSGSGQ